MPLVSIWNMRGHNFTDVSLDGFEKYITTSLVEGVYLERNKFTETGKARLHVFWENAGKNDREDVEGTVFRLFV